MPEVSQTPYEVEETQWEVAKTLAVRVKDMRETGALTTEVLHKLRKYFRIKNIYHSNAIEGNTLDVGETRLVVEQGLTISGKSLKDQAEAKNLSAALDFLEELATNSTQPITETDVRQIHFLVLKGINDANAGKYRAGEVEISGSKYKPASPAAVPSNMEEFGKWLKNASIPGILFNSDEALVAACAAHTWFVTIHPFIDGNGRVARLLMNLILMRYSFPIAVITNGDKHRYYDALEISQSSNLTSFVALIVESVNESLEEYEAAAAEHRESIEWAKSLASKFDNKERVRVSNHYEVWRNAMELLKSLFRQTTEVLNTSTNFGEILFNDFGNLEFEKYVSLKNRESVKKTWFFRLDFRSGNNKERYLFFFGYPSMIMRPSAEVTLHISREDPPGTFHYERLDALTAPNVPNTFEIGYNAKDESFIVRGTKSTIRSEKVDSLCRKFVQEVVEKHFAG